MLEIASYAVSFFSAFVNNHSLRLFPSIITFAFQINRAIEGCVRRAGLLLKINGVPWPVPIDERVQQPADDTDHQRA